ncbi:unannotated protein [freshwater metagenome]|uniref:Unannotated protein n=1 Tax=freshwater metagenome TaxID=449393 RepID=A0A6J7C9P7_9ZZZZ
MDFQHVYGISLQVVHAHGSSAFQLNERCPIGPDDTTKAMATSDRQLRNQ